MALLLCCFIILVSKFISMKRDILGVKYPTIFMRICMYIVRAFDIIDNFIRDMKIKYINNLL